jgi:hypothetical protein
MSITAGEPVASRRDVDLLRDDLRALSHRVDGLDIQGPRGMLTLTANMTELTRDLAEVRGELVEHRAAHAHEAQSRARSRRWAITASLGAAATAATLLTMMAQVLAHLH